MNLIISIQPFSSYTVKISHKETSLEMRCTKININRRIKQQGIFIFFFTILMIYLGMEKLLPYKTGKRTKKKKSITFLTFFGWNLDEQKHCRDFILDTFCFIWQSLELDQFPNGVDNMVLYQKQTKLQIVFWHQTNWRASSWRGQENQCISVISCTR